MAKERIPRREGITFEELGKTPEKQIERLWIRDNEVTTLINLLFYKIEDLEGRLNRAPSGKEF
tara:strand:+ start:159525 stop:159713 length:189 start_codon:yes stop_codon:yes gene_type:complete